MFNVLMVMLLQCHPYKWSSTYIVTHFLMYNVSQVFCIGEYDMHGTWQYHKAHPTDMFQCMPLSRSCCSMHILYHKGVSCCKKLAEGMDTRINPWHWWRAHKLIGMLLTNMTKLTLNFHADSCCEWLKPVKCVHKDHICIPANSTNFFKFIN